MRSIYLVLTQTGSILSKAIKVVTKKKYNHVSLSFDSSLCNMYSFGRKYPYNPFVGVFVVEGYNRGTYLRFKNTKCCVIEMKICELEYNKLYSYVMDMVSDKERYRYNILGLFLARFGVYSKFRNRFYCSEFVRYVFELSGIDVSFIPKIAHPMDFLKYDHMVIYEGLLKDYKCEENSDVLQ
jgi:hypothetical protein